VIPNVPRPTFNVVPHPWYGSCDGFGPHGTCSECVRQFGAAIAESWAKAMPPVRGAYNDGFDAKSGRENQTPEVM